MVTMKCIIGKGKYVSQKCRTDNTGDMATMNLQIMATMNIKVSQPAQLVSAWIRSWSTQNMSRWLSDWARAKCDLGKPMSYRHTRDLGLHCAHL